MSDNGCVIEETSSSSEDNEFPSSSAPTERVKNNISSFTRDKGRLSLKKCHKQSGVDTNSQEKQSTARGLKVSKFLFAPRKSLFAPSKEEGKISGKNGEQMKSQQSNLASPKGKAFRNSTENTLKTSFPNSQDAGWEGLKSFSGHLRQAGAGASKTFVRERNSSSSEAQEMPITSRNEATVSDDRSSRAGSSLKSPTESAKQYEKAGCSGMSSKEVFVISESENDDDSADDYDANLTGEPASTKKHGLVSKQGKSSISNSSSSSVNSSGNIGRKTPRRSENSCIFLEIVSSESSDFESPCSFSQKMKNDSQVNQKVSDKRNCKDTSQAKKPNETSTRRFTKRGLAKCRTESTDSSVPLTLKVSSSQVNENKPHIMKEEVKGEVVAEEKLVVKDDNDDGKLPELLKVDPQSSFTEDGSVSSKDASGKLATDANKIKVSIFENFMKNKLTLSKLVTASINSLRKKESVLKERANAIVVISDEELEESNNNSQLEPPTTLQRQDSNADNKTSLLKSSTRYSKPWSLSRSPTMASNSSGSETCNSSDLRQAISNSPSEDSSHDKDQNVFPALARCEFDCSLSQEVPYQGEVENKRVKCHENSASSDPNCDSPLHDTTFSSMPSLQRKPSSIYEQEHPEACSPPLLSQYFPESYTSTLPEKFSLSLSFSPESTAVTNTGNNSLAASGKRSPSSESSSNGNVESGMFTGSMFSFNNKTEDNVKEKINNIIDMLNSEAETVTDPVSESVQSLHSTTQESHGPEPHAQSPENEFPEFIPGISISVAVSAGQSSSLEPNLAVVKTEKDVALTDTASASFYSEIDDDIYVLDSDDEVYFQSQSVQSFHSVGQDKSEEKYAFEEEQSDGFLIIDFDDEEAATGQIEAESGSKSFVVTNGDDGNTNNGNDVFGRRISFSGISNVEHVNTRDQSTDDFHKKHSFSADSSNYCGNSLKNKPFDESSSAKDLVDANSDYCQTLMDDDDDDDVYIAHTQVNYTTHSDDDAEQAKDGAELTEGNTSPAGNEIPSTTLSFKGSNDSAQNNTKQARVISEMSDSSQGSSDTQDPFSVQTLQCSAEDAQSLYNAETQAYSLLLDEDTQDPLDKQDENQLVREGAQALYNAETQAYLLPLDEDTQDPLDKQDENQPIAEDNPFEVETQAVSPPEYKTHDHFLQNASSPNMKDQDKKQNRKTFSDSEDTQDPFTNIQECLTTNDNDTYQRQTLIVSPLPNEDQGRTLSVAEMQKQSENACSGRLDIMEDTQDPFNTDTEMDFSPVKIPSSGKVSLNPAAGNQILTEDRRELPVSKLTLYDKRVTSTPVLSNRNMSCKKSTEDLFNIETQKAEADVVLNSKRGDENSSGDSESFLFTDTQRVKPKTANSASPDKESNGGFKTFFLTDTQRVELVTHSLSHDKDSSGNSEGLFSVETQRIEPIEHAGFSNKDSSENSETIFFTETQRLEPVEHAVSLGKVSSGDPERLFSLETQRIEPIAHVASPDKSSSGDSERVFSAELQLVEPPAHTVSSIEDSSGDSEIFFSADTQRIESAASRVSPDKDSSGDSERLFSAETQRMEPTEHAVSPDTDSSGDSERLFSADTQLVELFVHAVSPDKDSSGDSERVFATETQLVEPSADAVSLTEDSSGDSEIFFSADTQRIELAASRVSPDKDSRDDSGRLFFTETQRVSPPAPIVIPDIDSGGDSETFFSVETQKMDPAAPTSSVRERHLNKDPQGLFTVLTQKGQTSVISASHQRNEDSRKVSGNCFNKNAEKPNISAIFPERSVFPVEEAGDLVSIPTQKSPSSGTPFDRETISSSSFSEDSHGPFSVETQIDSESKSECPYDKETISVFTDEDTQDPYSLETVKESTQSQGSIIAVSESSASASTLSRDPDNVFLIETQKVSGSGSCDKETVVLSGSPRGDKDSSEGQVDLEQEQDNQDCYLAATQVDDPHITDRDNLPGSSVNSHNDPQFVEEEGMFIGETVVDMPTPSCDGHIGVPVVDCISQKVSKTYELNQSSKHSHGLSWKNSVRNDQPAKPGGFTHLGSPELESHHNSSTKAKQTVLLAEIPDRKIKKSNTINASKESSYDLEQVKKHIPHILPNDYRVRCSYVDASSISELHEKASTASTSSFRQKSNDGKMAVKSPNEELCSNNGAILLDTDVRDIDTHDIGVASSSSHKHFMVKIHEKKPPTGNNKSYYKYNIVAENHSQWANIPSRSGKRAASTENTKSVKRMRQERVDGHKIPLSVEDAGRKHNRENEFEETAPVAKRSKGRSSSDDSRSLWMAASKRGTSSNSQSSNKNNNNNPRNQRSISCSSEKSRLTSQVQSARHVMENRRAESTKHAHEHKEASTHAVSKPCCNDDVEMPSTQDMMRFGLPILSAQLPVSKKHFAAGLPSQGRIASEEKNQIIEGHSLVKNKQTVTVPPVPKLQETINSASDGSDVISSAAAVQSDTSEILVSSTADAKEFSRDQTSNVPISEQVTSENTLVSQIHTTTKSVAFNMKPLGPAPQQPCQTVSESTQWAASSNFSNQAHDSLTEQPNQTAGPSSLAFPAQLNSVEKTLHSYKGTKAHLTPTVQPNHIAGPSSLTLTAQPPAIGKTFHGHKSIIKNNVPQSSSSNKSLSRVNFKASPDIRWIQAPAPSIVFHELMENTKPRPEAKLYFLSTILKWSPKWLEEREFIQRLPDLFGSGKNVADVCCQLRMFYTSFQEYVGITLNLLVLECWETIYRDWKMNKSQPPFRIEVHLVCLPKHPYTISEGRSLMHAEFTALLAQSDRCRMPSPGDVLIIDFWGAKKLQSNTYDKENIFQQLALVHSVSIQKANLQEIYKIFESSTVRDKNPIAVRMTLVLLKKATVIVPSKLHVIRVISSINSIERQIDALINLPESPLCAHLLEPKSMNIFVHQRAKPNSHLRSKLNEEQASAVETILQSVCGDPYQRKFFLLQGPPGTGKSHTILALIHQILVKSHFKVRICLATPSNAAVDEIANRIISFSNQLTKKDLQAISLVRVGNRNKVLSSVKPFTYEELVEKELNREVPASLRAELSSLEKQMSELVAVLDDPHCNLTNEQRIVKERRRKELWDKISSLNADIVNRKKTYVRQRYNARCRVLDTAHVICGTLNSLGSDDIREIILRNEENRHRQTPFTCLIIDEATQAIEVDCIIPLRYKMTKVILVGDQEQLPATVLSQEANEKRLARSLFERMDLCIRQFNQFSTSSVMMLTRQYRMHPEILSFPNSFYDGRLVTDESVLARKVSIAPYLVFDIQESQESRSENNRSVSNESEAFCTAQLCQIVKQRISNIGVICPYADQRQAITDQLRMKKIQDVQVNTVDSFQGQEKEVIIMSCVRAQSSPSSIGFLADMKRLNVALTRAKQALYVIGHFNTLCMDDLWKGLYQNGLNRGLLIKVAKLADFRCCAENAILKKCK